MVEKDSIVLTFDVDSDDFTRAGEASSRLLEPHAQTDGPAARHNPPHFHCNV